MNPLIFLRKPSIPWWLPTRHVPLVKEWSICLLMTILGSSLYAQCVPAPDIVVSGNPALVCADEANTGISLSTNFANPADVSYVVTGVVSSSNVTTLSISTVLGSGNGVNVATPVLVNSDLAGSVTYELTPVLISDNSCVGAAVNITATVEPEPVFSPPTSNQFIGSGTAFQIEMQSPTVPTGGAGDVEFLLTAISSNPFLNEGNTLVANSTLLTSGQFLSETLINTSNSLQTVNYTIRPQLNSSRTNPADPTTATCTGVPQPLVTIGVLPVTEVVVTEGNISTSEVLICDGEGSGLTLSSNVMGSPFSVGFRVTNRSVTNVAAPVLYNLEEIIGFDNVPVGAPVLLDATVSGEVEYEITPFHDLNFNSTFDAGEPEGNPETIRIVIEPNPIGATASQGTPILLCQDEVTGNTGMDVMFDISSSTVPSSNSSIKFTLESVTITDNNPGGGIDITTIREGDVIANTPFTMHTGAPGMAASFTFEDAYFILSPQNFQMPVTITYEYSVQAVSSVGGGVECVGNTFTQDVILQPSPVVEILPGGPLTICEGDSIDLLGNVIKNVTVSSDFGWSIVSSDLGILASIISLNNQMTTFTATVDNSIVAGDTVTALVQLSLTDANGCVDFDTLQINVISGPVAVADTLALCEDASGSNTASFDLSLSIPTVTGGASGVSVSFHGTLLDAELDVNALISPFITSDTVIIARVENDTTGCTSFAQVVLTTDSLPFVQNDTLEVCEDIPGSGSGTFVLADAIPIVGNGVSGVTVTFHSTLLDAESETNLLSDPFVSPSTIIYARVEDDTTGCFDVAEVTLTVNPVNIAFPDTLSECEIVPGGLAANFILTDADTIVNGGVTGLVVTYHEMHAEAVSGINPLTSPHLDVTTIIYARVTDTLTGCFDISEVYLMVDTMPTVFADTLTACENDFGSGEADFILTDADAIVTGGVAGLVVTYHSTSNSAHNGVNPIISPFTSGPATIYARVTDTVTTCYDIAEVLLEVLALPAVSNDTLEGCEDVLGAGTTSFDLNATISTVSNGATGVTVSFHGTLNDADNDMNPLVSPLLTGTTVVYARVENDTTGCYNIAEITIIVHDLPAISIAGLQMSVCTTDPPLVLTGSPGGGAFTIVPLTGSFTDNGNGTATFNPAGAALGRYDVTYTAADPVTGCQNSVTVFFDVVNCSPPTISITDPCGCRESFPGSQGNATTLVNGQFEEIVTVNAPTGQVWYIASVSGLYDIASPQPPAAPTPFVTGPGGTLLVEGPPGVYTLPGIHIDGIGYSITVTNGTDTLSVSNTCFYPNPTISGLLDVYCTNENAVTLIGNAQPGDLDTFNILNVNTGVVLQSNVLTFNPVSLGSGLFGVEYIIDEPNIGPCLNCNPGCVQSIVDTVEVVNSPGSLACNDLVNISLDADCEVVVEPDAILEGSYANYGIFNVVIFDRSRNIGDTVTGAQIGRTLQVRVYDRCTGNYCWGNLIVEDKMAPVFQCSPDTIVVACTADLSAIPAPIATDNCDQTITPQLIGEDFIDFPCGRPDSTVRIINRYWRAKDDFNNTSATCQQVIKIVRRSLADVVFPPDYDGIDEPSLDCAQPMSDAHPDLLGYPTIDGQPLFGGNLCMLNVGYQDQVLNVCGVSKKILREWTVFDWCAPLQTGVNPLKHTQFIKFEDTTPPAVVCPSTIVASTDPDDCTATVAFPAIQAVDNCSGVIVQIITPYGVIRNNGGFISGFPLGDYDVTYHVRDSCGNDTTCVTRLIVEDQVEPVAICVEYLAVSLTTAGEAEVNASAFDGGSFDNCCIDRFEVKRMGEPDSLFAPSIVFDCDDSGDSVNVIVRIWDCFDNYNECMVVADISDKLAPVLICPADITIGCQDDISTASTGMATAFDGCPISQLTFTDNDQRDDCGVGRIVRTFRATDVTGNTRTCSQIITAINDNPFDSTTIVWPRDTQFVNDCGRGLHPDSLPAGYNYPVFPDTFCANLLVNYEDMLFDRVPGACFKILRTWTIIDWCVYNQNSGSNAGRWTHQQTIKVVDQQDPILFCPDSLVAYVNVNCVASVVLDTPLVVDCNPNIIFSVSGDLGNTFGIKSGLGLGTYEVTITANDNCNNTSSCTFPVIVRDTIAPTPVCRNINVELGSTGEATISASQLDASSMDNCTDVRFSYSLDINDTSRLFTCLDTGANQVSLYVWDDFGNVDFCVDTVTVQDNMNVCGGSKPALAGAIKHHNGDPVASVLMKMSGINPQSMTTGNDGKFTFQNLQPNGDYTVVPSRTDDAANGVSTFDLARISKHILHVQYLDSPYDLIAADANNSKTISTLDLVAIRKVVLRVEDKFPNNTSWRFVKADYVFPVPSNPWYERFPELHNANNITISDNSVDFVAIKIGDVNGSVRSNSFSNVSNRDYVQEWILKTREVVMEASQDYLVQFNSPCDSKVSGYQFTIRFEREILDFIELLPGEGQNSGNFGLTHLGKGAITVSWNTPSEDTPCEELFAIRFRALKSATLSDALLIDGSLTESEAYFEDDSHARVHLRFEGSKKDMYAFRLFQNEPNPFSDETVIRFIIPENAEASLQVYDMSGKPVLLQKGFFNAGMNQFRLNKEQLGKKGMLYYRLQTGSNAAVRKMIILE